MIGALICLAMVVVDFAFYLASPDNWMLVASGMFCAAATGWCAALTAVTHRVRREMAS